MPSRVENDHAGPTAERLRQAGEFFSIAGRGRSGRRITMLDDALGRAWSRQIISAGDYASLKKYALHWLAGGLQGRLGSVDLNRVLAFDPGSMNGLCKTEAQADHRRLYWAAKADIGERPGLAADQIACFDSSIRDIGAMLGYRSRWHGREAAIELVREAGYRLGRFWDELAKAH